MASFVTRSNRSLVRPFVSSNEAGLFCICPALLHGYLESCVFQAQRVEDGLISDLEARVFCLSAALFPLFTHSLWLISKIRSTCMRSRWMTRKLPPVMRTIAAKAS